MDGKKIFYGGLVSAAAVITGGNEMTMAGNIEEPVENSVVIAMEIGQAILAAGLAIKGPALIYEGLFE